MSISRTLADLGVYSTIANRVMLEIATCEGTIVIAIAIASKMLTSACLTLTLTLLVLTSGCASSQQFQSAISSSTLPEAAEATFTPEHITAQAPNTQSATTVVSTGDGDTLRVKHNGETLTVRLACTDLSLPILFL